MAKRRIEKKLVHTHRDPVTGEMVREVRDDVWWAVFRAAGAVEGYGLKLPTDAFAAPWEEAVLDAEFYLDCLEQDFCTEHPTNGYRGAIRWEWSRLDAAGQFRFAEGLRAKLAGMLPRKARSRAEEIESLRSKGAT